MKIGFDCPSGFWGEDIWRVLTTDDRACLYYKLTCGVWSGYYTVCQCPFYGTLGLNGLIYMQFMLYNGFNKQNSWRFHSVTLYIFPASILYKSIAGRYRPVRVVAGRYGPLLIYVECLLGFMSKGYQNFYTGSPTSLFSRIVCLFQILYHYFAQTSRRLKTTLTKPVKHKK